MKFLHILTFLLLFTPIFLNIPTIQAQDSFEEEVRITAAGPMTFWEIELSGVNLTSFLGSASRFSPIVLGLIGSALLNSK